MMDAVKFLKKKNQICKEYGKRPGECFICPLGNDEGGCQVGAFENQKIAEEDLVQNAKGWNDCIEEIRGEVEKMRLIDAEKIMVPTSIIHNINGCCMVRAEDVQRIISDQPTAFDKEKVIEELRKHSHNYYPSIDHYCLSKKAVDLKTAIEIVKKGGIE